MDEHHDSAIAVAAILVLCGVCVVYPQALLLGLVLIVGASLALIPLISAALTFWTTIRWINRRDDPRHQKLPLEAP